jgi:hypothetical protein
MSKQKVLVQSRHVIFDDAGAQMSPGEIYTVDNSHRIEDLISEGFLSLVPEAIASEPKEETKKIAVQTKNVKAQTTEPETPTGEL